jgi:N-acetylglutamate synthase-like GNAT family acetyltransferase
VNETLPVRDATIADIPGLASLLGELGYPVAPEPLTKRVERLLSSSDNRVLVATRPGEPTPIGLLALHLMPVIHDAHDLAMIMALVITERARGEGVGRALIERATAVARERGSSRLFVTTHLRRSGAHAFYERLGFEFTGRRYVKVID